MILTHFSTAERIGFKGRSYVQRDHFKPKGLWVSDESVGSYGWSSWCAAEEYGIGPNSFSVVLTDDSRVLTLTTPDAIKMFDSRYTDGDHYIDWTRVAERWQGILITPYQWSVRLSDVRWYYPWDCASGCIWDPAAIASVTRIDVTEPVT